MANLRVRVLNGVDKKEWDERLKTSPQGSFYQSSRNADFFEKFYCYEPIYFVAENDRGIVKGTLLAFKAPPSTKTIAFLPFRNAAGSILKRISAMITWKAGPVTYGNTDYACLVKTFSEYVERWAADNGIHGIRMASLPYFAISQTDANSVKEYLQDEGYAAIKRSTVLINLSASRDELWNGIKKGSRYDVVKARNDGVFYAQSSDPVAVYPMYKSACTKNGIKPYPQEMITHLVRNGGKIFIAYHVRPERPVAGAISVEFNGIIDQRYLWNSEYAAKNKLFAMHLVTWSMIEFYNDKGCRIFDLVGVNTNDDRSKKEEGIYRFKTRWGGKIVDFTEFDRSFKSNGKVGNKTGFGKGRHVA